MLTIFILVFICLLQLTSTMLHLLGLTSKCDQQAIQDLVVKVRRVTFAAVQMWSCFIELPA